MEPRPPASAVVMSGRLYMWWGGGGWALGGGGWASSAAAGGAGGGRSGPDSPSRDRETIEESEVGRREGGRGEGVLPVVATSCAAGVAAVAAVVGGAGAGGGTGGGGAPRSNEQDTLAYKARQSVHTVPHYAQPSARQQSLHDASWP